jgi:hypothetical protein
MTGARGDHDERGQLTLLVIAFATVILLLLAVVTDVSKAFLVRRDLAQLADGAALAGTRGVAGSTITGSGDGAGAIELDQERAEQEVGAYLDGVGRGGYDNLSWTVTVDGAEVRVHLRAAVALPLVVPGTTGAATVAADGSSQLRRR